MIIYAPKTKSIIVAVEGAGDNLFPEDEAEGYVDYMMIECYKEEHGTIEVDDGGGQMMSEKLIADMSWEEVRDRVLSFIYTDWKAEDFIMLDKEFRQ